MRPAAPPAMAAPPHPAGSAAAPAGTSSSAPAAPAAAASPPPPARAVAFVDDDVPRAAAKAKAEGKALFVDAWAPWCHTCLSMKHYVLSDPSLARFEDRVVFAAIDTDRPENATFLARHAVSVWPTFFVIDPATDEVVGYWQGAASLRELTELVDESARVVEARRAKGGVADEALAALVTARAALARRAYAPAAEAYARAAAASARGTPRRSEALLGWMSALRGGGQHAECVRVGLAHVAEVEGAAIPADYCDQLLACASRLPKGARAAADARAAAVARLERLTTSPPADASADDRADALAMLAEARAAAGDRDGARRANEARLALLEHAAAAAGEPAIASTYDYARADAYLALGRAEDAVRMLEERERQLPTAYDPPARLAHVLAKTGKLDAALAAADRAIARAYGPRRLRYLKLRAEIQGKLGDRAGQIATLREEVAGHEALPPGQANAERLADAKRRLAAAERR